LSISCKLLYCNKDKQAILYLFQNYLAIDFFGAFWVILEKLEEIYLILS